MLNAMIASFDGDEAQLRDLIGSLSFRLHFDAIHAEVDTTCPYRT